MLTRVAAPTTAAAAAAAGATVHGLLEDAGTAQGSGAAKSGPAGRDEVRAATRDVLTAVTGVCAGMSLADLREVTGWVGEQLGAGHSQTDVAHHLLDDLLPVPGTAGTPSPPGPSADAVRVHLAVQMAEPITTGRRLSVGAGNVSAAAPPELAAADQLAARRDQVRIRVPHSVLALDDGALQLWVVLASISGTGERGGRSIDADFIGERAGWNTTRAAAERRVERAAKVLASAGALRVHRMQISGSRTRPVYELISKPAGRTLDGEHFETVTLGVVRRLGPALLKCHLHLLQLMGHQRRTRFGWTELAGRRGISERTLRRQVGDLAVAGLVAVDTGPHQLRLLDQPISIVDIEPGLDSPPPPGPQKTLFDSIEESLAMAHQRAEQGRIRGETNPPEPVDKSADKSVIVGREGQKCRPLDIHTKIYIPRRVRQHPSLRSVAARDDEPPTPGPASSTGSVWVPPKAAAPPAEEPSPNLPLDEPTARGPSDVGPGGTHAASGGPVPQPAGATVQAAAGAGRSELGQDAGASLHRQPPQPRTQPSQPVRLTRESYHRLVAATPWLARAPDRVRGQAAALLAAALDAGASLPALEAGLDLISDDHDPDQPDWTRPGVPEHERVTGLECRRVRQAITSVRTSRRTGMCPCCRVDLSAGIGHASGCPDVATSLTDGALNTRSISAAYPGPSRGCPSVPVVSQPLPVLAGPPDDIAAIVDCLQRRINGVDLPPTQALTLTLHRLKSQAAPDDQELIDWAGDWLLDRISRR